MEKILQPITPEDEIRAAQAAASVAQPANPGVPLPAVPVPLQSAVQPAAEAVPVASASVPMPGQPQPVSNPETVSVESGAPASQIPQLMHQAPVLTPVTPNFAAESTPAVALPQPAPIPPQPVAQTVQPAGLQVPQISIAPAGDTATTFSPVSGQDASAYFGASASTSPALQHDLDKARLPIGVYILSILTLIVSVIHFLAPGTASYIQWAIILDALLAIGLLTRSNLARQFFIFLALLSSVLLIIGIVQVMHVKSASDNKANQISEELVQQSVNATSSQQQQDTAYQNELADTRNRVDHILTTAIWYGSASILVNIVEAGYLMRPNVRAAFTR